MVSTFTQPNSVTQSGTAYKTNIDDAVAVMKRLGVMFAVHQQTTADMTIKVEAGHIATVAGIHTEVTTQNSATLTSPTTNPRKDIVYIDKVTGIVGVATGVEDTSPVDPTIPTDKIVIARIHLTVGITEITNADIDDLRSVSIGGGASGVPSGSLMDYAGSTEPDGWVFCDGSTYNSITDTSFFDLFTAIGTTYGGTGAADFKVPDMRGRTTIALDNLGGSSANRMTATSADSIGGTGGSETHALTSTENATHTHTGPSHTHTGPSHTHTGPSHTHTGPSHTHTAVIGLPGDNPGAGGNPGGLGNGPTTASGTGATGAGGTGDTGASGTGDTGAGGTGDTGSSGSGTPHPNDQPWIAIAKIIKK